MDHLSDNARAAQQALRNAAEHHQAVVEEVVNNPQGQFVERLRHAEERVLDAATRWALEYARGNEPSS